MKIIIQSIKDYFKTKKDKGLEPVFFEKIGDKKTSRDEMLKNLIKALEKRSACLMSNHGQVAFGKNLEDAFELAQEVENICHQYIIALKLGEPKILSFEEMKKVLEKAKNYKKE